MHTLIVIVIGLLLLGACLLMGHNLGDEGGLARAALSFLPVWFMGAGVNMYIGVKNAGYSVSDELPVFLLVFAVPAVVALLVWWKVH
jgi:hypothetical protein